MEKKLNIWNDYQNQKNYDLSFKTVDDNAPDHIVLKETKDDRGKNGTEWEFKIVSKDYIDTKNAEQDETARQQQEQITEHSHTLREHEEKIVKIEEKNTEQDGKISELENKNTEQDGKLLELENKNTEQDNKLSEHENRLEQLDGGHSSNLGKIGKIETTLDDHKGKLELLETETENYSPRIYRVHLQNMELKKENSIVKCTIDILAKLDGVEQNFSIHLSGILTVDEKNNHNNVLQLSSDNVFNEHIYNIELSNDDSLVVNIIHSKKIEIKKVSISEYSQVEYNPFLQENKNLVSKDYWGYVRNVYPHKVSQKHPESTRVSGWELWDSEMETYSKNGVYVEVEINGKLEIRRKTTTKELRNSLIHFTQYYRWLFETYKLSEGKTGHSMTLNFFCNDENGESLIEKVEFKETNDVFLAEIIVTFKKELKTIDLYYNIEFDFEQRDYSNRE